MNEKMASAIEGISLNSATYKNEIVVPTFVNFFYGRNGAGKTTIAQAIKKNKHLKWQEGKSSDNFEMLVYDQEFITKNFYSYDNLPGVFSICEKNIEIEKDINNKLLQKAECDHDYSELVQKVESFQSDMINLETIFQNTCWNKSKSLREQFEIVFKRIRSKKVLSDQLININYEPAESLSSIEEKYILAYSDDTTVYNYFFVPEKISFEDQTGYKLMAKSIVSSGDTPFANFINALQASDWVKFGHDQFAKKSTYKCPYCQQALPYDFEENIKASFDEQYLQDIEQINAFLLNYKASMLGLLARLKDNSDCTLPSLDLAIYNEKVDSFENIILTNLERIKNKIEEPTSIINLQDTQSIVNTIIALCKSINERIANYNSSVNNRKRMREEVRNTLWGYLAFTLRYDIDAYQSKKRTLEKEIQICEKSVKVAQSRSNTLAAEISELRKQIVNTSTTVNNINALLRDSGFQGFELREKTDSESSYEVVRPDGYIAESLSEGERNFIAFLYFYYLVKGSNSENGIKDKIVIIDDPVSSMDSGSLFLVASLVREMIEVCYNNTSYEDRRIEGDYIKQIFILTHNVYFHREITSNQVMRYKSVSFYMIRKVNNESTITLCVRKNEQIPTELENYNPVQNSYAALWSELREVNSAITVLNVERRIIEYYFIQLCGYAGNDVRKAVLEDNKEKFISIGEDGRPDTLRYHRAAIILSYINNPSGINDGLNYIEDCGDAEQYKEVFKMIFEATNQEQHYRMMMGE